MVNLNSRKLGDFLGAGAGLLLLININLLTSKLNLGLDLTGDKRYTLSQPVIQLLRELDDVVYIDVYLKGNFPAGFERLENSVHEIHREFGHVARANIQYNFIDPENFKGKSGMKDLVGYLGNLGIQPTNVYASENGNRTEKLILPGAVISYGGRETGVMFLKGNKSASPQEQLNQSIEGLEYEFASAISRLTQLEKKRIGLIRGHGELENSLMSSAISLLNENFDVFPVNLPARSGLEGFDVVIIAKPENPFSENDIYKLDQFIMNGGNAIFLVDALQVDENDIGKAGTIALPLNTNLDHLLFKYGVRINKDLVLDLNSGGFPVVTGNRGNAPNFELLPWPYLPLLNHYGNHPIVHNLDAIFSKYISSIDTVYSGGVRKIPLIFTSAYAKVVTSPVRISLNDLKTELDPKVFNHGPVAVAYLLEGSFTSVFQNRFLPDGIDKTSFRDHGKPARILVISDGDILRNGRDQRTGTDYDLGYDPWLNQTFANKDFILNAVSFLADDRGIIVSRNRQVTFRPLDKVKIEAEKTKWQVVNLAIPVISVIIFGIARNLIRKNRFVNPS